MRALPRRGFHVVGVEAAAALLARTFRFAQAHGANIELVGGGRGGSGVCAVCGVAYWRC